MKTRIFVALSCTLFLHQSVPAHAQWFGFPEIDTPKPAPAPVPAADVQLWLKNLTTAKENAEKAAKRGDVKARDAAIQDAAKWTTQICDPFGVSSSSVLKAFELVGQLAREMGGWNATFGDTKLIMLDVRSKSLIDAAKGPEKARLLAYKGDIQAAQDYGLYAFDAFAEVVDIPDADASTLKYAIEHGEGLVYSSERPRLKKFYERILALPLTPAEREEWQLKQHCYVVETEYKGEAREASLKALKTVIDNPASPLKLRDRAATAYLDTLFSPPERLSLVAGAIGWSAGNPRVQSKWLAQRGELYALEDKWDDALADYQKAKSVAPDKSVEKDRAFMEATWIKLKHKGAKLEIAPDFETLAQSPFLDQKQRFDCSYQAAMLYFAAKSYPKAKETLGQTRVIAGKDDWQIAQVDCQLAQCELALGKEEVAVQVWKAIPFEKLTLTGGDKTRIQIVNATKTTALDIYSAAKTAKKYALAQQVVDTMASHFLLGIVDRQLLDADLAVLQGNYDKALAIMLVLSQMVQTDSDKATMAAYIENIQKMKTDAQAKATPPAKPQ